MTGKVVLVGAGPGDVDLLTLKGKEYIEKADCIVYDRLASKDILDFAKADCELIFVGKENHHHVMKQEDINRTLFELAEKYQLVVRLKGGDPYVFGRGGEEACFLRERGVEVEVLSGVTSAVSVLASAGIPITHRSLAKGFQVITAHSRKDELADIDYTQLLDDSITLVFLMGLSHVGEIARGLINAGRDVNTPCAVISKGTTPEQKKCVGTLIDIEDKVKTAKLLSPAIIVVGDVVTLSSELDFFEKRPLFGKKVFVPYIEGFRFSFSYGVRSVTAAENSLVRMLRDAGADVTSSCVGRIRPVDVSGVFCDAGSDFISLGAGEDESGLAYRVSSSGKVLCNNDFDQSVILTFTSANGVHAFMYNLAMAGLDIRAIAGAKIAAVGEKTAAALKEFSLAADFVPEVATAKELSKLLSGVVTADTRLYYFSAKEVDLSFEESLKDKCDFRRIVIYENAEVYSNDAEGNIANIVDSAGNDGGEDALAEANDLRGNEFVEFEGLRKENLLANYDFACFSSASNVMRSPRLSCKAISIGPSCTRTLKECGYCDIVEAKKPSYEAMIECMS